MDTGNRSVFPDPLASYSSLPAFTSRASSTSHCWLLQTVPSFLILSLVHSVPRPAKAFQMRHSGIIWGLLGFVTPCCDHSRRFPGNFHALVIVPTPFSGAVSGPEPKAAMESVGYVPPINACTTCCPAQLQQQGQTTSQKGIQQSGVGFYTAEDRKLQQSMVFQIIHDFPAFSVTTPDFHGNPHMLWEVVLFAYVEPCSHLQG